MSQRFVVQSLEDFTFLFPHPDGDVGFCQRFDQVGYFDDETEAYETAQIFMGNNFIVIPLGS